MNRLFTFIFVLFSLSLSAQKYNIVNYTVKQGLPNSNVYATLQDSRGFMWFGTEGGGLCCFDGKNINTYTVDDGLAGNVVRSLIERANGQLVIGTDNGISIFDGKAFKNYTDNTAFSESVVLSLYERDSSEIWFGTNSTGLSRMRFVNDSAELVSFGTADGLPGIMVTDICPAGDSILWLGTPGAVSRLSFENDTFKISASPIEDNYYYTMVWDIEIDQNETLWASTLYSGVFKYDLSKPFVQSSFEKAELPAVENQPFWNIEINKNGELWVSSDKSGIVRLQDGKLALVDESNGLSGNQVYSSYSDKEGNVWVSVLGKGVSVFKGFALQSYDKVRAESLGQVNSIAAGKDGAFWLATSSGLYDVREEAGRMQFSRYAKLGQEALKYVTSSGSKLATVTSTDKILLCEDDAVTDITDLLGVKSETVNCFAFDRKGKMWLGTNAGLKSYNGSQLWDMSENNGLINNEVQTIVEDSSGVLWVGTLNGLAKIDGTQYQDFDEMEGLTNKKIHALAYMSPDKLLIGTFGGGVYEFDLNSADSLPIKKAPYNNQLSSQNIYSVTIVTDSLLLVGTDKGISRVETGADCCYVENIGIEDGFVAGEVLQNASFLFRADKCSFGTNEGISVLQLSAEKEQLFSDVELTGLRLFYNKVEWSGLVHAETDWFNIPENPDLAYDQNHLSFDFVAFNYQNPAKLRYSYMLEGSEERWSPLTEVSSVTYPNLPAGSYVFKVKATADNHNWSKVTEYRFSIEPPFWKTVWFYIFIFVVVSSLVYYYVKKRERKHIQRNIRLERIVRERTKEIVEQRDKIEKQHETVLLQKKEITDSIHYAERIQKAVLPAQEILKDNTSDSFILFKPRDIVSGDFYWIEKVGSKLIFTAADCTGHGVPGAFMSMLGVSGLNKLVNEGGICEPSEILNSLRASIIDSMKQTGAIEENKDGMDMALCVYDLDTGLLQFAGANNPLILIRDGELFEYKADKMPVAIYAKMDSFTSHSIEVQKGDTIYMFSDGFPDQFGGPKGKKFKIKVFKQLLVSIQNLTMEEQCKKLDETITDWMNELDQYGNTQEQIDDICVMGVRF